jgi:hypothetical protein
MGLALISAGGGSELWKFGTHERVTRGTPLVLWANFVADAVNTLFSTLRLSGTQVGYSVTAGMTLLITRMIVVAGAVGGYHLVGYSDADLGLSALADGANPVLLDSDAAGTRSVVVASIADVPSDYEVYYRVPAGKFPRISRPGLGGGSRVMVFGHEI